MSIKSKFAQDFILNTIASLLVTAVQQLLIYPLLGERLSEVQYGLFLTSIGLINTVVATIGNSLNNTRLLENEKKDLHEGVFQTLLFIFSVLATFILVLVLSLSDILSSDHWFFLIMLTLSGIFRAYYVVEFRLNLNFKRILIHNGVLALGYLMGLSLYQFTQSWLMIFLIGELCGVLHLLLFASMWKAKPCLSPYLPDTGKRFTYLISATLLGNLLLYLDRLIILPVLGGEGVSIYATAAYLGKISGIIMVPLSGVILSYFAQKDFKLSLKQFWQFNALIILMSSVFYLFIVLLSHPVTSFFYPKLYPAASPFIVLASLATTLGMAGNLVQPTVLKAAKTHWQVIIQIIYAIIYLGLGWLGLVEGGLLGFCYANIVANLSRLFLLLIIGHLALKPKV